MKVYEDLSTKVIDQCDQKYFIITKKNASYQIDK